MEKRTEIILLVLIFAFAVFIRLYNLGESSFWIDESISAITANKILETG